MVLSDRTSRREGDTSSPEALGQSEAFIDFQEKISKVAPVDRPVLILGERGTGKELAASRIHFLSQRWSRPFVTLNCAALTSTLIGSELFGYEKGAFTGAATRRRGRFEMATEGTLFLDEIGSIPMEVQEKILRVVEYGSFERVGASDSTHVDVRIVAATNVDLVSKAESGRFKQDLLDRLSFEVIYVPPLRNRKEDIQMLADYFAQRMAFELGWEKMPVISSSARKNLESYPWPGNIRELKNVIERAIYKSPTPTIKEICFDPFDSPYGQKLGQAKLNETPPLPIGKSDSHGESSGLRFSGPPADRLPFSELTGIFEKPFKEAVGQLELCLLSRALKACQFNQKMAARKLGLSYDQFRGIKKKYAQKL